MCSLLWSTWNEDALERLCRSTESESPLVKAVAPSMSKLLVHALAPSCSSSMLLPIIPWTALFLDWSFSLSFIPKSKPAEFWPMSLSSKVADRYLLCLTIGYSPISLLSYSSSTLSRCLLNFDPEDEFFAIVELLILSRPSSDEVLLLNKKEARCLPPDSMLLN